LVPVETFDTQDAVPEDLRDSAIETKDGKFLVLREDDTSGLKSALEKERQARKEADRIAKDTAKRLHDLELEAKAKEGGLTSEKLAEIRKQVAAEFEPWKTKAEQVTAENRALRLNDRVKTMLDKVGFIDVEAGWKLAGDEFDLTDDGQPIVKAEPGKSLEKHVADIAARYPGLVRGSQASGSGAAGVKKGATGTRGGIDPIADPVGALSAHREQHAA
jgi:hypothetical protein